MSSAPFWDFWTSIFYTFLRFYTVQIYTFLRFSARVLTEKHKISDYFKSVWPQYWPISSYFPNCHSLQVQGTIRERQDKGDSQGSRNPQTFVLSQRTAHLCHNDAHFGCWPIHREQTIGASQSNHYTDLRQHRWLRLPLSRLGKVWINSASPLAAPSVDKKKREAVDMIPDFMQ